MNDYSADKIKNISRSDVSRLVGDLVEELHMDCSKKIDTDIFGHTVRKVTGLLCDTSFRDLEWKTVLNISKMGLTSSYGTFTRIDFQTIASWLYKSQPTRSNYADKSIQESADYANLTAGDFRRISGKWSEFREWMQGQYLWFIDNISEHNCNMFHAAQRSGSLTDFRAMLVHEPDPEYFEQQRRITLEQFKQQHEREEVFS